MNTQAMIRTLVVAGLLSLAACESRNAVEPGGPPVVRHLTQEQYRQSIVDIFGSGIQFTSNIGRESREAGLLAIGSSHISVPPSSLELYAANARSIAAQVTDQMHRVSIIGCQESAPGKADMACLKRFIYDVGRLLYRRPLTREELQAQYALVDETAKILDSGYAGVGMSLSSMLAAPQFLFRWETGEPNPMQAGQWRLDAFSKASRLSFFLWNTAPDAELLQAAESGSLHNKNGWSQQVERLLTSPRAENGLRAFFTDFLALDTFSGLSKDQVLFPNYSNLVASDAQEQTLRTITDLLAARGGDYRDIFTTRSTFLTQRLGMVYRLPVESPQGWQAFEVPEGDPRGVGILSHLSFVGLHSHPGRSSPTLRGKALRELLLCQKVPDPPGNVDFTNFEKSAAYVKTARERLTAHAADPLCAGCHKITDPIGLAMEQFDTVGGVRRTENGAPIDASGNLDGVAFADAAGLGRALHDNPAAPSCLVNRLYAYAVGRMLTKSESDWVKSDLEKAFARQKYRFTALLRTIVTDSAFVTVTPPAAPSPQVGATSSSNSGEL